MTLNDCLTLCQFCVELSFLLAESSLTQLKVSTVSHSKEKYGHYIFWDHFLSSFQYESPTAKSTQKQITAHTNIMEPLLFEVFVILLNVSHCASANADV